MLIRKGQKHPDYDFDTENKRKCYDNLYKVCPNGMKLALTFPNLSNFRMEWELKEKYPELKVNCFESDKNIFHDIESDFPDKPQGVSLFNKNALDYLDYSIGTPHKAMYDLIFIDSCGPVDTHVCKKVLEHLNPGGILAITQNITRRHWDLYDVDLDNYSLAIAPYRYGAMEFSALRKNAQGRPPATIYIEKWDARIVSSFKQKARLIQTNVSKMLALKDRKVQEHYVKDVKPEREICKAKEDFLNGLSYEKGIKPYLCHLPPKEEQVLTLYFEKGKSQEEIAKMFCNTQGAIHFRIAKAFDRIRFVRDELPSVALSDKELEECCAKHFDTIETSIIKAMKATTCQSAAADLVNKELELKDGNRMNQVKVRYRFLKCINLLSSVDGEPEKKLCAFLKTLRRNLYKLHPVHLPHFDKPYDAKAVRDAIGLSMPKSEQLKKTLDMVRSMKDATVPHKSATPSFSDVKMLSEYRNIFGDSNDLERQLRSSFNKIIADLVLYTAVIKNVDRVALLLTQKHHSRFDARKVMDNWVLIKGKFLDASKNSGLGYMKKYYDFMNAIDLKGPNERTSTLSNADALQRAKELSKSELQRNLWNNSLPVPSLECVGA